MENKKIFVIAFKDVDSLFFWRIENYNFKGDFEGYGKVKWFWNRRKAEEFMLKYTDSRCFDFYVTEINRDELKEYERN